MATQKKLFGAAFQKQKKERSTISLDSQNVKKSFLQLLAASSNVFIQTGTYNNSDNDSKGPMDSNPSVLQANSTNDVKKIKSDETIEKRPKFQQIDEDTLDATNSKIEKANTK